MKLSDLDTPYDGAGLLDKVRESLTAYVIFPSDEAADAVTLWTVATHAQPAWEHATRLVIKSPLKRCGKTRLQEVIGELCHKPIRTTNISVAALVRSIDEEDPPTLILDESDGVFGKKAERTEGAEDKRCILNAGHSRGWPYIRWDATVRRREECATFAMAIIGGIGDMPDTIEDRAVIVVMRRRAPGEPVTPFRRRRSIPPLRVLREQVRTWVIDKSGKLATAEPDLPVEDREADVWESLVAIADAAGGHWPDRARAACTALTGTTDPEPDTASERLLADLKRVYGSATFLYSETLCTRLAAIEEAPWAEWRRSAEGREPINKRGLAGLLKPYEIRSRNGRENGTGPVQKGYYAEDLADAWSRYVRNTATDDEFPQVDPVAERVADEPQRSATATDQPLLTDVAEVAEGADGRPDDTTAHGYWLSSGELYHVDCRDCEATRRQP